MRYILFVFILLNACKEIPQNSKIKNSFSVEQISDGVIYEVNIRQYSKEGTFDGFTKDIPKLKALGVKVLWLMPIHPISKEKRKGELGSYYSVSNYKGINPEFGDDESFDRLVQTAHDNDMLLIIDWVANHTGWDHPWIKTNPDFYTKNEMGEITDPINPETGQSWGWTDVADLNFDNLEMQDAMISARVERDGDYFLRVRESAYLGDDNSFYLLHIGRFPTPLVGLPPGGKPGETLSVEYLGDLDGPWKADLTLPKQFIRRDAMHDGIFAAVATRDGNPTAEGVPIRVSPLPATREVEPNDDPTKCPTLPTPSAVWGQLQQDGDIDWMRFEAAAGSKWYVRAWGRRLGSPIDITLNAYQDNDKRQRITGNDDSAGPDSAMTVTVPQEGTFLVRVSDHQDRGGETFVWWIEATPVEPLMRVSVPPATTKSQQRLIAQVPQGNRVALVINASRTDVGDEVQPHLRNLPKGVQATPTPLPGNSPSSLLVFEAAKDAELAATMAAVDLVAVVGEPQSAPDAKTNDEKPAEQPKIVGELQQPTELVHGNPNRTCWRQSFSDRLPVSVVAAVPVEVELVEPPVPLVQSGRLDLRVKIKREEGFEGAIRLTFPFRPPGVGAASGVNVPADVTEVVYPINANDKAAIGPWGVVVTATVTPKGELAKTRPSFEIASRPVTLTVREPMLQLAVDRAAGELGSEVLMVGKLTAAAETSAKAMLLGLPAKCSVKEVAVSPGDMEVTFPITVPEDAPVGKHGSVVCELHVPQNDDWVIHKVKAGELRIDKPLPAPTKVAEKKPVEEKKPAEPKPKVLSRRERLREQARVIAAAGADGSNASGPKE